VRSSSEFHRSIDSDLPPTSVRSEFADPRVLEGDAAHSVVRDHDRNEAGLRDHGPLIVDRRVKGHARVRMNLRANGPPFTAEVKISG
jgi:hypothetical protein